MKARITLNIKKYEFNTIRVNYLKTVLLKELEISKKKINLILNWLVLTDLKQV